VTRFALGTVQFGLDYGIANAAGRVADAEVGRILECARARGVDVLDTAIAYGDSEARLGAAGVSSFAVVSKLPGLPTHTEDVAGWVEAQVAGSLARLRQPRLYGLLLHRPADLLRPSGDRLWDGLRRVKDGGLVEKLGVSIYDPSELDALADRHALDVVQAPFNVFDRRLLDSGWLHRLASRGVEVHVRSVFLQRLLLLGPGRRPSAFDRWAPLWARWDAWLERAALTPLEACLRFALSVPDVSRVVVGVDSAAQLNDILDAAVGSALDVPADLRAVDLELITPSKWSPSS